MRLRFRLQKFEAFGAYRELPGASFIHRDSARHMMCHHLCSGCQRCRTTQPTPAPSTPGGVRETLCPVPRHPAPPGGPPARCPVPHEEKGGVRDAHLARTVPPAPPTGVTGAGSRVQRESREGDRGQDTFSATKSAPEPGRTPGEGSVTSRPFPARAGSFPAGSSGRSRRPER